MEKSSDKSRWTSSNAIICCFALAKLLIHFISNRQYGYFRDELYFLACGEHLDWGFVDHAPMIALAAKLSRAFIGDSLFAIRFLPAVAGAVMILLAGLMAKEFGGGRFAVFLACLCSLAAPVYLVGNNMLTMNAFEPVFWMGAAYFIILAINRNNPRYWILFGLAAGLGLENKHSMLFFGFAILVGILLTPERRFFKQKWIWIGGGIALLIFLPNLIWEYKHDWATVELLRGVQKTGKNIVLSPVEFIAQQFLLLMPLSGAVWAAGIWFLLFDGNGKRYRLLGIAYLVLLAMMIAMKGKNYYLAPAYPMLFSAGGVFWEQFIRARSRLKWLKFAYPALIIIAGAAFAPMVLPILPVETLIRYQEAIGFKPPKTEVGHIGKLPQHFGDMFGWPEMVDAVAKIYNGLPSEERAKAAIYASNYGEAGAIDLFGPRYGLPKAISPHQNYFLWGPREYTGEVMIVLQWDRETAEERCDRVEEAAVLDHPYAMAEERKPIFICRGLKKPLQQVWPRLKHWN